MSLLYIRSRDERKIPGDHGRWILSETNRALVESGLYRAGDARIPETHRSVIAAAALGGRDTVTVERTTYRWRVLAPRTNPRQPSIVDSWWARR